ncbi:hypothetical protein PAXRUDRAFT_113962, partial [Paxillus rubicundulus Ve08.2h10]
ANHEAADTSNPNTMCTGTMKPAGTSYGLPNGSKEVEGGKGERDERASGSAAPSLDNNSGDEVCHIVPLEGEKTGQQLSRHPDETTTHL